MDLVAMVHLGDPLYYKQLNEMAEDHDRILYELIVDKELAWEDSTGRRHLKEPMVPAFDQLQLAARHGLQAQLEALDYMKERWVLADMERSAIRRLQAQRGEGPPPNALQAAMAGWGPGNLQVAFVRAKTDGCVRSHAEKIEINLSAHILSALAALECAMVNLSRCSAGCTQRHHSYMAARSPVAGPVP